MLCKRLVIVLIFWTFVAGFACSTECGSPSAKEVNLSLWSTSSLPSPDQRWQFVSVGPNSSEHKATLYIQSTHSSKKWNVGWIERDGTVFWSEDSKRVFLRDEYAADDTKIRVFDVAGLQPREIKGLDEKIRKVIFAHIPENETTLWLYYPQACFAGNDSSTILLTVDAPRVRKRANGSGKPFSLKLAINLNNLQIVVSR